MTTKFYLDTANLVEIKNGSQTGVISGVTTNPTLFAREKDARFEQLKNIFELTDEIVFVQTIGDSAQERFEDFNAVFDFSNKHKREIGIKVPMDLEGLKVVKLIKDSNSSPIILGTAIYSREQSLLAAIAGCDYVAPYYNRMTNQDLNAYDLIYHMRKDIEDNQLKTRILAASFKNTQQVLSAIDAGAHDVTISYELLELMMNKTMTVEAIKKFNEDGRND